MIKKFIFVLLMYLFCSVNANANEYSILQKFIDKKIDGCKITNIKYNEVSKDILVVCIKDTNKIYHFYIDIKAGYECGEFKCGSEDVTKEVLDLLSK